MINYNSCATQNAINANRAEMIASQAQTEAQGLKQQLHFQQTTQQQSQNEYQIQLDALAKNVVSAKQEAQVCESNVHRLTQFYNNGASQSSSSASDTKIKLSTASGTQLPLPPPGPVPVSPPPARAKDDRVIESPHSGFAPGFSHV